MLWTIVMIVLWLLGFVAGYTIGRNHSQSAGYRHRRGNGPDHPGLKAGVNILTTAGQGRT